MRYMPHHLYLYMPVHINFWYSGVYHMKQRDHEVFFRNAWKMQVVCLVNILTIQ